jgi:hypothetical protein
MINGWLTDLVDNADTIVEKVTNSIEKGTQIADSGSQIFSTIKNLTSSGGSITDSATGYTNLSNINYQAPPPNTTPRSTGGSLDMGTGLLLLGAVAGATYFATRKKKAK